MAFEYMETILAMVFGDGKLIGYMFLKAMANMATQ